jgi:hypothetical protein
MDHGLPRGGAGDAQCGTLTARHHCIFKAVPVLDARDCSQWKCRSERIADLPHTCCLPSYTPAEAARLLNGSAVMFMGTGCRYGAYSLEAFLSGKDFDAYPLHDARSEVVHAHGASVQTVSYKFEFTEQVLTELHRGMHPPAFRSVENAKRRILVLSFAAHDLRHTWKSAESIESFNQSPLMGRFIDRVVEIITFVKNRGVVDTDTGDIILVQLPRPVARGGQMVDLVKASNYTRDPVNEQLALAGRLMKYTIGNVHPEVGVIDMGWAGGDRGIGRHVCAPYDGSGSRFASETSRHQALFQMLYAVQLLQCPSSQ